MAEAGIFAAGLLVGWAISEYIAYRNRRKRWR